MRLWCQIRLDISASYPNTHIPLPLQFPTTPKAFSSDVDFTSLPAKMKEHCIYTEKCDQTCLLDAFLLSLLSPDNSTIKPFSSSFLKRLYRSFEATQLFSSAYLSHLTDSSRYSAQQKPGIWLFFKFSPWGPWLLFHNFH